MTGASDGAAPGASMPWKASLLLGAGTFVVGAVAPLYDTYVPPLLQRHLGSSALVGAGMGIDNVLALFLVPFVGALSDATHTRLGRRMPYVLAALPIAALALAILPLAERRGLLPLLAAMIVVDVALSVWRAPFSALLAELVPSVHRSKTEGILGLAMCLGAMLVLGVARDLSARDPNLPFVLAGGLALGVWAMHAAWLREPPHEGAEATPGAAVAPLRAVRQVFTAARGLAWRFFLACLLFQMAFQSFSSWFTLHASERFHTTVADVSLGFIAVAIATLLGSLPAGWLGARFGRRRMSLMGIAGMSVACVALHVAPSLMNVVWLCALFGFSWAFPVANLMPMALELGSAARAGAIAGAFLLVQSVAGIVGPASVGVWFDAAGSKRALFVLIALFLAGAFLLLATLRSGFGETPAGAVRR
jgi:maltose/moltooligosaccharide transporter